MEEHESSAVTRMLHEARLPRMKSLDAFEFDRSSVSAAQLRTLAEGDYVTRAEPILLVGEAGTSKTYLVTGLCVAACQSALNSFQGTGVRPCGWTELSGCFDRLPGVLVFELRGAEIAQRRM